MGNKGSSSPDGGTWDRPPSSSSQSSSTSGWQTTPAQVPFSQYAQNYPVQNPTPPAGYPPVQEQHNAPPSPPRNYGIPSDTSPEEPPIAYPYIPEDIPMSYGTPSGAPTQHYSSSQAHPLKKKFDKRYSMIADNYNSLEEVTEALARAGLESSNLIVGIDFTKSNEWTGKKSYNGKSLHHIGYGRNPYEEAITIIGKTMAAFDDDNLIPCFGFGDASTHDQDVFSFYPGDRCCHGFEEVISRYRELVPNLKLAGPTSFAPIIEMAMTIVEKSGGQYHVLLIIADGQVTRSVDTEYGQLSPQERKTVQAIVEASKLPLSVVLVGVGDGPWDTMKEFDDNIPAREFDNFQFVNFTEIMSKNVHPNRKETEFALAALMEIPHQYKATIEFNLLGRRRGNIPERFALPPPVHTPAFDSSFRPSHGASFQQSPSSYYEHNIPDGPTVHDPAFDSNFRPSHGASFQQRPSSYYEDNIPADAAPSAPSYPYENQMCPICLINPKNMAFGCGHQTCVDCGKDLQLCPTCRLRIETRLKLY